MRKGRAYGFDDVGLAMGMGLAARDFIRNEMAMDKSAAGERAKERGVLERAMAAALGEAAPEGVEVRTVKLVDTLPLTSDSVGIGQDGWKVRDHAWRQSLVVALKWGSVALAPVALLMLVWTYVQRTRVPDFPSIVVGEPVLLEREVEAPELERVSDQGVEPVPVRETGERAEEAGRAEGSFTRQQPPVIEKVEPPVLTPVSIVDELFADAEKYFGGKYFGKAEKLCEEIIERESREPRAYFLLGDIHLERGEFDRAKLMYEITGAVARGDGGE